MLDPISPPSIPRRPKKQSQVNLPNYLEDFERSDTESDNEQMISLESLKSKETNDKIPMIPKRPDRSKSLSKSPSLPIIPKRPRTSDTPDVEALSSSFLPENEQENNKNIYDKLISLNRYSDNAIGKSLSPGFNSDVKDMLGSDVDVSDGDKASGNSNTKSNTKRDLNVTVSNSMRNYDDGLETVQQELDDTGSSQIENEVIQDNNDCYFSKSDMKSELGRDNTSIDPNNQIACENQNGENDERSTESRENKNRKSHEEDIHSYGNEECENINKDHYEQGPNIPKVTEEQTSENKDSNNIPHVPRRPKKSKTPTGEPDAKLIEGEGLVHHDTIDHKQPLIDNKETCDENTLASSMNETSQSKPDTSPLKNNTSNPKPPPKPKKLSSKIAAFQQMFNQEHLLPKSSQVNKSASKLDLEEKPLDNKESPSRLSSDKMKFAQNLQGMMGKGIAMPGMVDPNLPQNVDAEQVGSPHKEVKILNVKKGVVKGPRGKKLPKSLKTPVNIEVAPRFNSFILTIWELDFQTGTKTNDKEESGGILSNNTEALKLTNNFDNIMDAESKSCSISVSNSSNEEDSFHMRTDYDDSHLDIHKPAATQLLPENVGDTGGIKESEI